MNAAISSVSNSLATLPIILIISAILCFVLVLVALHKKDFVKAKIWRGKSGFSIEAGNAARKRQLR